MIVSVVPINEEYVKSIECKTGERIHVYAGIKEAMDVLPEAEIVIGFIDGNIIEICSSLKWLFILSAGVEMLPFALLEKKGITVTNVRGIHAPQIAEQTMGMMIIFSRRLNQFMRNQGKKIWDKGIDMDELTGKTVCIIGAGSIGMEIARKAKAFDMRVIGLKKDSRALKYFDEVWDASMLHKALNQSDYNVLITPLTDETYHLIGQNEFEAMKRSSVFINMSRGDTVDEEAMVNALLSRRIAGAGLDVFHEEPLSADSPLWNMDNVVITSHIAGKSPHYMKRSIDIFEQSLIYYRQGMPLPNIINLLRKY